MPSVNKKTAQEAKLLFRALKNHFPEIILNGPKPEESRYQGDENIIGNRLPNNLNISLLGINTEYAVIVLDKEGIAASTKSACASSSVGLSTVVKIISGDSNRASSTIRFSLGPKTDLDSRQADRLAGILKHHTKHMKILDLD